MDKEKHKTYSQTPIKIETDLFSPIVCKSYNNHLRCLCLATMSL